MDTTSIDKSGLLETSVGLATERPIPMLFTDTISPTAPVETVMYETTQGKLSYTATTGTPMETSTMRPVTIALTVVKLPLQVISVHYPSMV